MRRIVLAVLFIWFIGPVISEEPLEKTTRGVLFDYEDSTSGIGHFVSSCNILANSFSHTDPRIPSRPAAVYLRKTDHGSGSIEKEMLMRSDKRSNTTTCPDYNYNYALVNFLANSNMVYGPQTMSIGNGYYATHPVNFNSLLSDEIQIKNYASETSMAKETNYAHNIDTELLARLEDSHLDTGGSYRNGLANILMNINENIIEGTAHIGMLRGGILGDIGSHRFGKGAWHEPSVDIGEDYTGTFSIATKMNLTIPVFKRADNDDWMPCCFGGYLDMPKYYQMGTKGFGSNVKDIFDCTCPKKVEGA